METSKATTLEEYEIEVAAHLRKICDEAKGQNFYQKVNSNFYGNHSEIYPRHDLVKFAVEEVKATKVGTLAEINQAVKDAEEAALAVKRALNDRYREIENRFYNEFKADLYEEEGVTGNPKADQAFSIAWSRGHSSGYNDVAICFSEMVELIKD